MRSCCYYVLQIVALCTNTIYSSSDSFYTSGDFDSRIKKIIDDNNAGKNYIIKPKGRKRQLSLTFGAINCISGLLNYGYIKYLPGPHHSLNQSCDAILLSIEALCSFLGGIYYFVKNFDPSRTMYLLRTGLTYEQFFSRYLGWVSGIIVLGDLYRGNDGEYHSSIIQPYTGIVWCYVNNYKRILYGNLTINLPFGGIFNFNPIKFAPNFKSFGINIKLIPLEIVIDTLCIGIKLGCVDLIDVYHRKFYDGMAIATAMNIEIYIGKTWTL